MTQLLPAHLLANEHTQSMGFLTKKKMKVHHPLFGEFLKHHVIQPSQLWGRGVGPLSLQLRKQTQRQQKDNSD